MAVPTDVTDEAAVQRLAQAAVERFGGVDIWVNNAGVYAVGRFEDTPSEAFARIHETNFLGSVYGARAVLPHLRARGAGSLVFVASVESHLPAPLVSAYVSSKWAVRGFAESLRQELRREPDIHVAVISPSAIDTPLFHHSANYTHRQLKAPTPTFAPEKVAGAIVHALERPRRETIVGAAGKLLAWQRRLAPSLADRVFAKQIEVDHFGEGSASPSDGNLFKPMAEGTATTGGWNTVPTGVRRAGLAAGAALAAAIGAGLLLRR